MASNFPTAYVRVASQTYVLQHIYHLQDDQKARLPVSKSSHMITFWLDNGVVITLRTSGTEPKIKVEYNIGNGQLSDVTWSAHVMGRYLANAIVSDKSK